MQAERRTRKLQDAHDALALEVARLSKEAANTEVFRERVRALNLEASRSLKCSTA
jgi:hypothetical protein